MSVSEQYVSIKNQVERVAREAGRNPEEVLLISVSKTVGVAQVAQAIEAGAHDFGENRPDCICEKAEALPQGHWHFIGNIQSRAIPRIVEHACLIHSVYQDKHILAIEKAAQRYDKVQDILIEVNVSGEASKDGCTPDQAAQLVARAQECEHIRVRGLMTMAPQGDKAVAAQTFRGLKALFDQLRSNMDEHQAADFSELSMGMSEDWPEAIQAGATMIRVGRAIFSERFDS